jgi:dextranase
LLAEGAHALQNIPFDGLHIDQYGDPKLAWDSNHNPVDLPKAFIDFIQSASDQHPDQSIVFNAVGNWPIQALAESAVDFMYIEVWPPDVGYRHLAEIVLNAVRRSHGKAVVIAHYLPASRPTNNLLADAVIVACGGTRIELGEEARLLSDPYFPKHEEISSELYSALRRLSDFIVRNGEWLSSYTLSAAEKDNWAEDELNPKFISIDNFVMTVVRRYPRALAIQLVNFNGLDPHQRWDEMHAAPAPCQKVSIKVQTDKQPSHIFWDCPEQTDGAQTLDVEYADGTLIFQIPQINFMGLVAIHE